MSTFTRETDDSKIVKSAKSSTEKAKDKRITKLEGLGKKSL